MIKNAFLKIVTAYPAFEKNKILLLINFKTIKLMD